jgi:hypothetical protein
MSRVWPAVFACLAISGTYFGQQQQRQEAPVVAADPAPLPDPPPAVESPADFGPPIPGTSSEVQVRVAVEPPSYVAEVVVQDDACQPAAAAVYVAVSPRFAVVQAGPIRRILARQPVRTFWRGVASRIANRVQARTIRRVGTAGGGNACSAAGW